MSKNVIKLIDLDNLLCYNEIVEENISKIGGVNMNNKEKKNKRSRRILLLLMLMLTTSGLLAVSSYAWFTANKNVTVSTLNVNVQAQNGIQISTNGTTWKSVISNADITGAHATYNSSVNQIPTTMEPVSTGGNANAQGQLEMFLGVVTADAAGDFKLTATKQTDQEENGPTATGKYIAFDLFFKVDADTPIYLTTESKVTTPDVTDNGIQNAARVAFGILGNTTAGSDLSTIQGLNAGTGSRYYIWEPNNNLHSAASITHAKDTYGLTISDNHATAIPYSGIIKDITSDNNVKVGEANATSHSTLFKDVTPDYSTKAGADFSAYVQMFTLTKGVTKVRVYMWIEGQDVDCQNGASGSNADFDLKFSTDAAATP